MPPRPDKLLLRGLRLHGRHGVLPAETALGQPFVVDVEVEACTRGAARSDDVRDALDYTALFRAARDVVARGPPLRLLETVADRIARRALRDLPAAAAVTVRVAKPHVPIHAVLDHAAVEIFRRRGDEEVEAAEGVPEAPDEARAP